MIHYSLRCAAGHVFDGWFASSAAFDRQVEEKLLGCPTCGTTALGRAPMAPALARGISAPRAIEHAADARPAAPAAEPPAATQVGVALVDERMQKMRALMKAMREAVLTHGTDVGRDFPDEARKIHYGETEPRGIYGQADGEEARALVEEGIAILPLPAPDDAN